MAALIYDNFIINKKVQLNYEDNKSLTLLYLPLMGIDSYTIYTVLNTLNADETYTYKKLLDILNFISLKDLNQSFEKLEGLGLIKTYLHSSKGYMYELIAPLNLEEFFNNELLYALLVSQIGECEVEKLNVKNNKKIGYKEITKKFNEVFEITTSTIENSITNLIKPNITLENKDFNYTLFKVLFDSTFISDKILDDPDFKERIYRISYIYKLDPEEMKDVIIKTVDIDKNLEYPSISKNARIKFQEKYKTSTPRIATINNDSYITSIHDDEAKRLYNYVENISFTDVLQSISGIKPSISEIKMFEELMNNTKFSMGVINMMILLVSKEKDGELPNYNYFEKIANTWARAKIKNPYDVIKFVEKQKSKIKNEKNYKTSNNIKEVPIPEWYKEYNKGLSNQEEVEMSDSQKQEMLNLVKDMFG